MHRVVLDTNVLVSAFLFFERSGPPAVLLRRAAEGRFALVASRMLLVELEAVLSRSTALRERYAYTPEMATAYRSGLEHVAILAEPQPPFPRVSRDRDDDMIIATAVAGEARYLITGDDDILSVREHQGVRIVTPRQFLVLL